MDLKKLLTELDYDIVIGIDPGKTGGVAVISPDDIKVYPMPITAEKYGKKVKSYLDIPALKEIFAEYDDKKVLGVLERVHAGRGEGTVSMFTFGEMFGSLKTSIVFSGFDLDLPTPQSWKKKFPELENQEFTDAKIAWQVEKQEAQDAETAMKLKIKLAQSDKKPKKEITALKGEEKLLKSENKKSVDKAQRKVKSVAKRRARELCQEMFPALHDEFKLVKHDGKAEALLMALYAFRKDKK